jgi:ribonuclease BN (tRNA processing enzyme)
MRLVVLGCSGGYPGPAQACSGYLLETGSARFWIDAGSGTLAQLHRHRTLPELDATFITHLHADHWTDLPLAIHTLSFLYTQVEPLPVFGPSGFVEACGVTLRWNLEDERPVFEPRVLHEGLHEQVAGAQVEAIRVEHGEIETYGLRLTAEGRTFAYSADSRPCEALVRLARDADLFLCEAGTMEESSPMHLNPRQAGELAKAAGARRLALTHLRPGDDAEQVEKLARTTFPGELWVARVGLEIDLRADRERYTAVEDS